jgi:hypothetical protein
MEIKNKQVEKIVAEIEKGIFLCDPKLSTYNKLVTLINQLAKLADDASVDKVEKELDNKQ